MLKLREDEEEDVAIREDEPFVISRLDQSALLREAFLDVLNAGFPTVEPTKLESIYKKHAEARRYRGLLPIGLFGAAQERRHLAELTDWYQAVEQTSTRCRPYQSAVSAAQPKARRLTYCFRRSSLKFLQAAIKSP